MTRNAVRPRHVAWTLVALLLVSATSARASVDEVRLYVEGMACPFCTFGVEKSLKKVPGVVSVETTIRTGLVRVQLDPAARLDLPAMSAAVKKSGFTLSRIEATVTGRLVTGNEHPALECLENGQTFRLVEPGAEGTHVLQSAGANGSRRLTVSGRVDSQTGLPPALAVESFEFAP